jgi:hypothetical protein
MNSLEKFYEQNGEESEQPIVDRLKELFVDFATELSDELPLVNFGLGYRKPIDVFASSDTKTYEVMANLSSKLRLIEEYCMFQEADHFRSQKDRQKCFDLFFQLAQATLNVGMRLVLCLNVPEDEIKKSYRGTSKYFLEGQVQ